MAWVRKALNTVTRLDPDFPEGWFNMGRCLFMVGRTDAAVECLDKVLVLEPNHEWARDLREHILREERGENSGRSGEAD